MTEWIILAGLVIALALCSLVVSFYALYRAHGLSHNASAVMEAAREECAAAVEGLRSKLESMAAELHESSHRPLAEPLPGEARSCMNLTRRSQALRLRRKGDSPQHIAESLGIPRQEVDLLIKVHEIVVNNV
jgi:DNA-binding NarL/FixJ family response regulator